MAIVKNVTAPNGVPCAYHKPVSGEYSFRDGVVVIRVGSWYTKAAHDDGASLVWAWPMTFPIAQAAAIEAAIVANLAGPFHGGRLV